ncbi:MAG TPA: hypothetical protein VMW16_10885 [Sedimentisphaerales bacterium]|nr:hypothetical protein [Sedimentisphaerales bacterium]
MNAEFFGSNFLEVTVMFSDFGCRYPCWPLRSFWGVESVVAVLAVAGVIFSLVMLVDCLKRPRAKFYNPITTDGEYDKLIWVIAIVASFWFYFLGAIIYFFVVMKGKPEKGEQGQ